VTDRPDVCVSDLASFFCVCAHLKFRVENRFGISSKYLIVWKSGEKIMQFCVVAIIIDNVICMLCILTTGNVEQLLVNLHMLNS